MKKDVAIDEATPSESNIRKKEHEKFEKCQELRGKLK